MFTNEQPSSLNLSSRRSQNQEPAGVESSSLFPVILQGENAKLCTPMLPPAKVIIEACSAAS